MSGVQPNAAPQVFDQHGAYVWANDAQNLRTWYYSLWGSLALAVFGLVVIVTAAPISDALTALFSVGFIAAFVTMFGCVICAYRVQATLKRLGLARTDPIFIVIGAVLSLLLTALIAPPAVLSNANKAARRYPSC